MMATLGAAILGLGWWGGRVTATTQRLDSSVGHPRATTP
jgi:hypothetical protein